MRKANAKPWRRHGTITLFALNYLEGKCHPDRQIERRQLINSYHAKVKESMKKHPLHISSCNVRGLIALPFRQVVAVREKNPAYLTLCGNFFCFV
jgi:hypothetical protein